MKIRAMIAEDEWLAREELAYMIAQEEDFVLCPNAENGVQLLELYREYQPDVLFLDIHMPGISGMDVARQWLLGDPERGHRPLVVFTTAYDDYAVEAFAVEAVDYLLKPYDAERFQRAVARVRKRLAERASRQGWAVPPLAAAPFHRSAKLLVEDGEKAVVLACDAIQYAVRTDRFIEIHTERQTVHSKWSLQELEQRLSGYPFCRVHRSYLVNLDYVKEIVPWVNGAYTIVLNNAAETKIPVSRLAVKTLFQQFAP
ncbi:DNA-binding response regulator [Alicyclobacillus contaminans]|uniref:LytR/AlgR family response regulator transcription factor n=1 Tax=Alicyclobacillus contaminans TaxID=392016 RepID=UPI000402888F|nr:LytTR family DNA-binding domain-containing protein [Alicyclobacillus contaminans]GMA51100.1 DNA-binding response regulator [Alicyclobacillus contaminans]